MLYQDVRRGDGGSVEVVQQRGGSSGRGEPLPVAAQGVRLVQRRHTKSLQLKS